ncbi:MAG: hypothetical protein ABSE82_11815 [Nitrososphaerales archaeon]|jgi:hypothetical protein
MSLHIEPGIERLTCKLPPRLEKQLDQLQRNGLTIWKHTFDREKGIRFIDAMCSYCKKLKRYNVDSLLRGTTKACACQRNLKYGDDPRADTLGEIYTRIVRRCNRNSHKQSNDHKGNGKCTFESREHFIRWALDTWHDTDFKGLGFERVDDHGDYSPDNLRLVTSKEKQRNRNDNVYLSYKGQEMHWSEWKSPYCSRTTQSYAAKGMTGEEIIAMAQKTVNEKRKGWCVIEGRLAQLGYIEARASQFSPVTEGMDVDIFPHVSEGNPTVATDERFRFLQ